MRFLNLVFYAAFLISLIIGGAWLTVYCAQHLNGLWGAVFFGGLSTAVAYIACAELLEAMRDR